jgi:hypothetical protein
MGALNIMPTKEFTEELKAQLESHDEIRVVDQEGQEYNIDNVSYDGEYDCVVIEISLP